MKSVTTPNSRPKHVNDLLHTLRGEQFRHARNIRAASSNLPYSPSFNQPTLPISFLTSSLSGLALEATHEPVITSAASDSGNAARDKGTSLVRCPGPSPPKSWQKGGSTNDPRHAPPWRARALSVILPDIQRHVLHPRRHSFDFPTPSLITMCLHILARYPDEVFVEDILPYLDPHLRSLLIRTMAIESPLSNTKLFALLEPDGHAYGELIVVGPSASLGDDYFIKLSNAAHTPASASVPADDSEESWEQDIDEPTLLRTCILMSITLANSSILSLPPTITHLGLINLRTPVPLYRLPGICPLLIVLDLSYNTWLGPNSNGGFKVLERVGWSRWDSLRTLGFRECHLPDGMLTRLNNGRWDDVELIQ